MPIASAAELERAIQEFSTPTTTHLAGIGRFDQRKLTVHVPTITANHDCRTLPMQSDVTVELTGIDISQLASYLSSVFNGARPTRHKLLSSSENP